jgi:hypothetical protein
VCVLIWCSLLVRPGYNATFGDRVCLRDDGYLTYGLRQHFQQPTRLLRPYNLFRDPVCNLGHAEEFKVVIKYAHVLHQGLSPGKQSWTPTAWVKYYLNAATGEQRGGSYVRFRGIKEVPQKYARCVVSMMHKTAVKPLFVL